MGSHRIAQRREWHPGWSDYELAQRLSSDDPPNASIVVRYKSEAGGEYDQFGTCGSPDMLLAYFQSSNCHDTEILYVHPLVPLDKVTSGLRITDEAPRDSHVFKLKQIEEHRRAEEIRMSRIQNHRHSKGQCIMCGEPLNFVKKLLGANRHTHCTSFKE